MEGSISRLLSLFYNFFHEMERCGYLDPDDDVHLWCLHLVFLPLINKHLSVWRETWINHPLSSEGNKTPMQLWIEGLHDISETNTTVAREMNQVHTTNLMFQLVVYFILT